MIRLVILVCLVIGVAAGESPPDLKWRTQREQQRKERAEFTRLLTEDMTRRAKEAEKQFLVLVTKAGEAPAPAQLRDLQELLRGIRHLDLARGTELAAKLPGRTGADLAPSAQKAWTATVRAAERTIIRPLEILYDKAVIGGFPALAHTVAREVLAFEPDHEGFHRILGETLVDGRWYGTREMALVNAGARWDRERAWILPKEKARYDKGEHFDVAARTWGQLAALQAKHRNVNDPWIVRTEHLEVRGTAELKDIAAVAERLEAFHDQVFAAFPGFFLDPKQRDPKLLFGATKRDLLIVNVARDQADYRRSLPPGTDAGWSAGMFVSRVPASFFYVGYDEAVYHEFTHQILHIFAGGDDSPQWLCEGIAVYAGVPSFVDGALVFGDLAANDKILIHLFGLRKTPPMSLEALLRIESSQTWSAAKEPGPQYSAAGTFTAYCMEADGRSHREDFIDFLRDAYRGQTQGRTLWDYMGMERAKMIAGFAAWQEAQRAIIPKPRWTLKE